MGLFEDLGERVERFKQQATDASREQADYVCESCEEPVYTAQEVCPHCGSEDVVAVDREPAGEVDVESDDAGGEVTAESDESTETTDTTDTDSTAETDGTADADSTDESETSALIEDAESGDSTGDERESETKTETETETETESETETDPQ